MWRPSSSPYKIIKISILVYSLPWIWGTWSASGVWDSTRSRTYFRHRHEGPSTSPCLACPDFVGPWQSSRWMRVNVESNSAIWIKGLITIYKRLGTAEVGIQCPTQGHSPRSTVNGLAPKSDTLLPLLILPIIGEQFHDPVVDLGQSHHFVIRLLDCHCDQGNVAVRRFRLAYSFLVGSILNSRSLWLIRITRLKTWWRESRHWITLVLKLVPGSKKRYEILAKF